MLSKLNRLSFYQLQVLAALLSSPNRPLTASDIKRKTKLRGKPLGAILSSLSRTKFRNLSLIYPLGKARDGGGLRWQINDQVIDVNKAKASISQLLKSYD